MRQDKEEIQVYLRQKRTVRFAYELPTADVILLYVIFYEVANRWEGTPEKIKRLLNTKMRIWKRLLTDRNPTATKVIAGIERDEFSEFDAVTLGHSDKLTGVIKAALEVRTASIFIDVILMMYYALISDGYSNAEIYRRIRMAARQMIIPMTNELKEVGIYFYYDFPIPVDDDDEGGVPCLPST